MIKQPEHIQKDLTQHAHLRNIKFCGVISLQKNAIRGKRINAVITSLKRCLINPMFSQLHSRFLTRGSVATLRCTYVAATAARELFCRFVVNVVIKFVFFVYMITLPVRVSTSEVFLTKSGDVADLRVAAMHQCPEWKNPRAREMRK